MLVKTETDGQYTTVRVSEDGARFSFEITIKSDDDGVSAWYENSNRETYNLVMVESGLCSLCGKHSA